MAMAYIREHYKVPAKRGTRITLTIPHSVGVDRAMLGTIIGSSGQYLRVRFDDHAYGVGKVHPTWNVAYHPQSQDSTAPRAATPDTDKKESKP